MLLYGDQVREEDLYRSIENLFKRSYARGWGQRKARILGGMGMPDFVYFSGRQQIHVVEVKRNAVSIYNSVGQLMNYPGNFRYIALPEGDFSDKADKIDTCIADKNCGLILISRRGQGFRAEIMCRPVRDSTDYYKYYATYLD